MGTMRPSLAAFAIVQHWESLLLISVKDSFGVWNVGWGEKLGTGDEFANVTRTEQEADKNLDNKLQEVANALNEMITVPVSQQQFDALCSMTYNCGIGEIRNSETFLPTLNAGKYRTVADLFLQWDHVKGVIVDGLLNRRKDERSLFLSGTPV